MEMRRMARKALKSVAKEVLGKLIYDLGISIGVCFQIKGWGTSQRYNTDDASTRCNDARHHAWKRRHRMDGVLLILHLHPIGFHGQGYRNRQ